jgi:ribosomal protein S18 acetylase RimI-like enzyme
MAGSPPVHTVRRPATAADAADIAKIYTAYDTVELGAPETDLDDVETMLGLEGSDQVVADAAGQVVGFAEVSRSGEVETIVDPSHDEERELHRDLLRWVVDRAAERGIDRIEHWAGTRRDGAAALLTEAGFEHARTLWRMGRATREVPPESVLPAGVELRPFDRDRDARDVWSVIQTSFAGAYGSHVRPFEEWERLVLGRGYDALLAVEEGRVIAVATVGVNNGDGHVGQLGVLPEHRGRGLAKALLTAAFRRDASLGFARTTLTVDGANDHARRLYESVGMSVEKEFRRWERDL